MNLNQVVLCLPREHFAHFGRFTPWTQASHTVASAQMEMRWIPRVKAELSETLVQLIPCALVRGEDSSFHVFRRIKEGRRDMSGRITLVIGGHIDCSSMKGSLLSLAATTLANELDEELTSIPSIDNRVPVGVVIDPSSLESSRHVGLLYEVAATGTVRPKAKEEFSMDSKYAGSRYSLAELPQFNKEFDPWSAIIFSDYIKPTRSRLIGHQPSLF